jgi:hypothetical protein
MMKRTLLTAIASAYLVLWPTLAVEADYEADTANFWLQYCREESSPPCLGYFAGLSDMNRVEEVVGNRLWCPIKGVTIGQIKAIALKYVREHPERWNGSFIILVLEGLSRSFPCQPSHPN